ncbi:hypothetical protein ACSBR1_018378 [Camellia fascicularis]
MRKPHIFNTKRWATVHTNSTSDEVCRKLESLFAEEGIKIDSPSLESIRIQYCERLKSLPNANDLRNLGQLEIRSCYNLESLSLGALDENNNNNNINRLTSLQDLCTCICISSQL